MSAPSNTGSTQPMGTPTRSLSPEEETPITPPRPRILCPGCSTELTIYHTLGTTEASMYASKVDMGKLGLQCQNVACPIHIGGIPKVHPKAVANPNILKYVDMAKKERDAIEAAKKNAQEEVEKRKREEAAAEYAKHDPFSGPADEKAEAAAKEAAARVQQRLAEDQNVVSSQWKLLTEGVQAEIEKLDEEEEAARRSRMW